MIKMLGLVLWTNAFDQNKFIQRLSLSERLNGRSSFGPRRKGHFLTRGRKMKPKKMADLFFSRRGIHYDRYWKREVVVVVFLLVCFFWWLSPSLRTFISRTSWALGFPAGPSKQQQSISASAAQLDLMKRLWTLTNLIHCWEPWKRAP